MNLQDQLLRYDPADGPRLIFLETPSGGMTTAHLDEWTASAAEEKIAFQRLSCGAQCGGPWAGAAQLFRQLLPDLEQRGADLMASHGTELSTVLPTLKARLKETSMSLTDISSTDEKVRNYPLDRAYRNIHGLIDLLAAWQEHEDLPAFVIVCESFEESGSLARRFFLDLMRRRGAALRLTLVLVAKTGFFDGLDLLDEYEQDIEFHDQGAVFEIIRLRSSSPEEPAALPCPEQMREKALELEGLIRGDVLHQTECLPHLIYHWLHSETPERAVEWQGWAFATYNHLGFYEDALPFGDVVLQNLETLTRQESIFTRWNLVGALSNCYLALGKPDKALEIVVNEALEKVDDPTDQVRISYVIALIYSRFLSNPDFEKAEEYIERGLAILDSGEVPGHDSTFLRVFTLNGLAFVRHRQGRPDEALELCREGYRFLEDELPEGMHRLHRSVLLYNSGQVHSAMRSHDDAIRYYSRAIDIDPNYSEYFNERGNIFLNIGELDLAIADYHEAISVSPPYHEVWTNLGQALKMLGRFEEAIAAYSRSLDLAPRQLLPRLGRAQVFEQLGYSQQAIDDYSKALVLDPDQPLSLSNRAVLFYEKRELERALADFNSALSLDPENPGLYFNRAVLFEDMERPESALDDYRSYLRILPKAEDRPEVQEKISTLSAQAA